MMVNKREGSIRYKLRSMTADLVSVKMTKTSPRGSLLSDLPICQDRCIRYFSTSINSRGRIITFKIRESHFQKRTVRVTPRFQSERLGYLPLSGRRAATLYLRGSPIGCPRYLVNYAAASDTNLIDFKLKLSPNWLLIVWALSRKHSSDARKTADLRISIFEDRPQSQCQIPSHA